MARGDNPDFRQPSFNAGEWAPEMFARSDHKKYKYALKRCRNSIPVAQGPLIKRPGTLMCGTVPAAPLRMKEFVFSDLQALVLVFTDRLLSFFSNGRKIAATVVTPYLAADLARLKFSQSGDVVTITCRGYAPQNLSRLTADNLSWSLAATPVRATDALVFPAWPYGVSPAQPPNAARAMPLGVYFSVGSWSGSWAGDALARSWSYAVTAVYPDGTESLPVFTAETSFNRGSVSPWITWRIDAAASLRPANFNIYLGRGGVWGLLDQVDASSGTAVWNYKDTGGAPNFALAPPSWPAPFTTDPVAYSFGAFYNKGDRVLIGGNTFEAETSGIAGLGGLPGGPGTFLDGVAPGFPAGQAVGIGMYYCFGGAVWQAQNTGTCPAASAATWSYGPSLWTSSVIDTVTWMFIAPGGFVTWKYVQAGAGAAAYPAVSIYNGQRRIFADFAGRPTRIVGSRVGAFSDFNVQPTPLDDDAIDFDLASNRYEEIRSFLELKQLMALTSERSWMISGANGGKPTPTSILAQPNLVRGASWLDPLVIGVSGLYVQALGTQIWELVFDFYTQSYLGSDVTLQAQHLFKGHQITRWAFAPVPFNIIWATREDGKLLGLTYHREEEVKAWHWHDTQGSFLDVCSIPETINGVAETSVYLAAQRASGVCIERMSTTVLPVVGYDSNGYPILDTRRGVYLDAAVQGTGYVISGLGHLEGLPVTVLADGAVAGPYTVAGGQINIAADFPDGPPTYVTAGLDYVSEGEQLDLTTETAEIRSNVKNVYRVSFEVANTRGMKLGADFDNLIEWQQRQVSDGFNPVAPFTGLEHIRIPSRYEHGGRICFRHDYPLPFTLLALGRETSIGGD